MLKTIFRVILLVASIGAIVMACVAMLNKDWPQACAWTLIEISCTLSSLSARD
jgi:hypothetical protein